ncbi:site-specific integrase [Streptomyces sp. NPDC096033]|uniref:site-specific integrase n=1 Tax=Streptomyces sp. NPDC096033 TaxID=3366071 RepID=UPI003803C2C6
MHTFIDVFLGQGSTSSRARSPKTVENYVGAILGTLEAWTAAGLTDPREITRKHIEDVLDLLRGDQARRLHTALRSFFRALKRARLVFRDPARSVSLTSSRSLPTALPSDRIAGLLDRLDDPRDRLWSPSSPSRFCPVSIAGLRRAPTRPRPQDPRQVLPSPAGCLA